MVFDQIKPLLCHFGYQTKSLETQESFILSLGSEGNFCVVKNSHVEWFVNQVQIAKYMELYNEDPFFMAELQKVDSSVSGYDQFNVPNKVLNYENIYGLMLFFQSGYVDGFIVEDQFFIFPPILRSKKSLLAPSVAAENIQKEIEDLVAVLAQDSDNAMLLNYLGKLYVENSDINSASKYFVDACRAEPHYAEPYSNMGTLMWEVDSKDKSFGLFTEALLRNPFDQTVQDNFVKAGLDLSELESMHETLNDIQLEYPSYTGLFYLNAILLEKLGKKDECVKILQSLLKEDPDDERVKNYLLELNE